MSKVNLFAGAMLLGLALAAPGWAQAPQSVSNYERMKQDLNQITVSIVVSGMQCTCARFAEDIRNVVNDLNPNGVRVLPILGVGGIQNLQDVLFLKGVDMGTVDQDHLEYLKNQDPTLYGNIEERVNFITKLYNSEFQIAARSEFQTLSDLQGKRVSFNLENSHTHIAADIIFGMAGVETVKTFHDNDEGLQLLKAGQLDAHIVLTGAPQSGIAKLKASDGVRLLGLAETDLPAAVRDKLFARYLPADLTPEHYPELIAKGTTVPTIATRTALAVYNWDEGTVRYKKIERFIHEFFGKIGEFKEKSRHPKWAEVNLTATIPGWKRFKPAQQWLDGARGQPVAALSRDDDEEMRQTFETFLARYQNTSNGAAFSDQDRAKLFGQFKQFLDKRSSQARN
jgi:TRAP transporter TAXI family solute receptor